MEQVIRDIAERLGLEVARVWPQVVAVTWFTSLFTSVVSSIVLLAVVVLIVLLTRAVRRDWDKPDDVVGVYLVGIIMLSIVGFVAVLVLGGALPGVFYPEGVTVMNLAKGIK